MKQQTKNLPSWSLQSISEMRSPKIGGQETIAAALEKREALRRSHAMLTATLEAAKVAPRMGRNEIRMIRTIDTKQITDRLNQTAKALRELDGQIQQTNWLVDL